MRTAAIVLLMSLCGMAAFAQKTITTTTIQVAGNCGECKARIENAADIPGVKIATWDEKTGMLSVTYRADKVSEQTIEKAIAAAGHDTAHEKAPGKAYNKLPDCCKYRSAKPANE